MERILPKMCVCVCLKDPYDKYISGKSDLGKKLKSIQTNKVQNEKDVINIYAQELQK